MSTPRTTSWREMRDAQISLLHRASGRDLESWKEEIADVSPADESALRRYLDDRGVRGYAQMLLVHETFGYPDFLLRSADELVAGQYADRPGLLPIHQGIIAALPALDAVTIQTRKTYVSLLTSRRTFARIVPTTRRRLDLALRWPDAPESSRLRPATSRMGSGMTVVAGLENLSDLDDEVLGWLRKAYSANS